MSSLFFGFSSTVLLFGVAWMINGVWPAKAHGYAVKD